MTKIALAQVAGGRGGPAAVLDAAGRIVEEAATAGASLVCFPEQFVTGWSPKMPPGSGEPLDGPLSAAFGQMAQENGIAVAGSIVEAAGGRRPRNTVVVLDAGGEPLADYAKTHLFSPDGEDCNYTAGDRIATFAAGGTTFGLAVCYDLRFPELFRIYALAGVECMLVPAAWPCCRLSHWETLLPARALENRYYVAGINTAGGPGEAYCGGSLAADPDGAVIARCGAGEELLIVELDPAAVHEAQSALPSLSDRRSDLYHRLLSKL
ncbi:MULTISPECIES: nitrilase-related carbon-nitrogen hydrolase [unclassified Methanoculleus]|uniref:nitrilase-related carbon-nitrogen hydrolase n=1 Tax=unclassified Methanoculleus TaxID=2619537 RepID=UPI0025E0858E|nr:MULTISPECIES: nitrilase-related carbon-nitrogen hydrolase [unclassified Methanoculleus]MCK9318807.1 nitrilase [Methanoculleus sp.]MDD2254709.1 nitrilase [Methanoculleus sp.]MDD2787469.1 nitrilase [Methanoculleus sp.]MDD3216753.1 nitrilase [Methanoculleus sp.]MDD4313393.1 nitrilase [Methanoculleus sp.]